MRRFILSIAGVGLLAGIGIAAQAQNTPAASSGNAAHGKALFASAGCYQCHGYQGQGGGMYGPRLAPGPIPVDGFFQQLRNPREQIVYIQVMMPVYTRKILADSDVRDIYAYLQSIPKGKTAAEIPLLSK